jgi:hypothetical protein
LTQLGHPFAVAQGVRFRTTDTAKVIEWLQLSAARFPGLKAREGTHETARFHLTGTTADIGVGVQVEPKHLAAGAQNL